MKVYIATDSEGAACVTRDKPGPTKYWSTT